MTIHSGLSPHFQSRRDQGLGAVAARIVPRDPATRLRPAVVADEPFIKHLFKTSREGDFAAAGLPDSVLDILLQQQFHAQTTGYAGQFPHAISLIVLHQEARAGRLLLQTDQRRWHMIDIVLLPQSRQRGLGTDIIESTAHAARREGATELTLSVLFNNAGARRLYGRLGFVETGDGVHVPMSRALGA